MTAIRRVIRTAASLCLTIGVSTVALAQNSVGGGPLTGPPVFDAPFQADATTTVSHTLSDGTKMNRRATARYYRDRAGRVRVEQTFIGLEALNPVAEHQVRITVHPDPSSAWAYTVDPVARTVSKGPRSIFGSAVGGGEMFAVPLGGPRFLVFMAGEGLRREAMGSGNAIDEEAIGSLQIEGIEAIGTRTTITIPAWQVGNDRPMQVVDERWESPELKLVVYSRTSDPRTGVVDYRLTNIRQIEPPAHLFVVPADYMITNSANELLIRLEPARKRTDPKRRQ